MELYLGCTGPAPYAPRSQLNMCRCCASDGEFKNVKSVYHWMGEEEVYADMLQDCLAIFLYTDVTGEVEGGICEACITQLRNATNFKRQVLHSEEKFMLMISNKFTWVDVKEEPIDAERIPKREMSETQSNLDNHSVSETYIATDEVTSSLKLTNVTDNNHPEKKYNILDTPNTEETEQNLIKKMTKSNVNLKLYMCRCCAFDGASKDFKSIYYWMGEKEVYADMLLDCLDISLNTDVTGEVESGICEACIMQLRNATSFKRQVLHTEEKFMHMLSNKFIGIDVKEEPIGNCDAELIPKREISEKQSDEDNHSVFDTYIAADEVTSLLGLTNSNVTDNKHPEKEHNILDTEETERNLIKKTTKFVKIITNSNVNFDEMALSTQDDNTNVCNICNYTTKNASILEFHMESNSSQEYHTDKKPYACETCDKKFTWKVHLEKHIRIHTVKKFYACEICDKQFKEKGTLKKHIRIHTGEKPYSCELCGKKFTQKSTLNIHIRVHTGKKPYACEICDKKFKEKGTLKKHIRIHTCEKSYACEICDKKFTEKGTLKRHIRIHTGEKPYACEICDKKFTEKGTLKMHIRIHKGEKPDDCEICGKKFTEKGTLKRHIRIHTGEKPYACEICDKKFTAKGTLKKHIRIHTGEKPYVCEICDKKFTANATLKKHIGIHTGEKPFGCKYL